MQPVMYVVAAAIVWGASTTAAIAEEAALPGKVQFNRDIRPILAENCFACHGPDAKQAKGGLRIDHRDSATKPGESGSIPIVPGKPAASELVTRILSDDPDERMPPPDSHKSLTDRQKQLLKRWIAEGAEYQAHWGFIAPVRPTLPEVKNKSWPRNDIDRFVLAKLEAEGLAPSPEADRPTLIRRLSFDLTGLPPTPEEVASFVGDASPDAYEKVVDRLLKSPRYGERMAMWWLDGARYADSNGYQADYERFMWPWRDWVIKAFNTDKPFDRFTVEQLAGDLLPNATNDERVATGFNRNHRINTEGGALAEEWHVETVIDRVDTTSAVWLGLTMGCCRCHNHKFDPITQKEFYQFFAFFNNVPEAGVGVERPINQPPTTRVIGADQQQRIAELDAATAAAEAALKGQEAKLPELQARWERDEGPRLLEQTNSWHVLSPKATSAGKAKFTAQPDGSYLVSGPKPPRDVYTLSADVPPTTITALQFDVLPHPSLANQNFGRAGNGNIVLSEFEAEWTDDAHPKPKQVKFSRAMADYSQSGWDIAAAIDGNRDTGWALDGNDPAKRADRHAIFVPEKPIALPRGGKLTVRVRQEALDNHTIGRFRLSISSAAGLAAPSAAPIPSLVSEALSANPAARSKAQKQALTSYYLSVASSGLLAQAKATLDAARTAKADFENGLPTVMVMEEMRQPRDAFILIRGQYDKHGDKVTAGVPAALPPLPAGAPANRLGLARWIVDPANPLTARVTVNRFWEMLFGVGIVKSSENFGVQAEWPSNLDLLDWLATEFIRDQWDMKRLQKTIVMSATYRQSSRVTPALMERDPENRLLARGPRLRLQAEMIRDNALAISGLLVEKLGGPSVRPYQPEGVWDETNVYGNLRHYKHDQGDNLYRRSLYTIWKRTAAPPDMTLFDMPSRELCVVRRSRTNTPLQALTLLNEVTYVEAARGLAQLIIRSGGKTPAERIAYAFQRATGRQPTAKEAAILSGGLERQLVRFRGDAAAAKQLLSVGDLKTEPNLDPAELAAYTLTANVILNLDETITKE